LGAARGFPKMMVELNWSTWHHNPEESIHHCHIHGYLMSYKFQTLKIYNCHHQNTTQCCWTS